MGSYLLTPALVAGAIFLGLVTRKHTPLSGIALLALVVILSAFFYLLS